jgi:hypothetical protein
VCHEVSQGPECDQCSHFLVNRSMSESDRTVYMQRQSGSNLHSHIDLQRVPSVFEKVLDPESLAGDQKSAPLSSSDMFRYFQSLYHIILRIKDNNSKT